MRGIVREVGVHLQDVLVVARQRPPEAGNVRRAESHLPGSGEQMHASVDRGDLLHDGTGAVGRPVVDHEHVDARVLLEHGLDQPPNILPFVERRDDDERASGPFVRVRRHVGDAP